MAGPHDPDHASSAGLALRAESEETAHFVSTKEARAVNDSRTPPRFWLVLATLVPGLAALAIGIIFFSALPGTLAAETIGAGLALLIVCVLLLTGVWGPVKRAQPSGALAAASVAAPDRTAEPAAPTSPDSTPETPSQTAPTTATEASNDAAVLPEAVAVPELDAAEAGESAASAAAALPDAPPAPRRATPKPEPAPTKEPPTPRRATPKRAAGQTGQNGHAIPAAPRTRASRTPLDDAPLPLPPPLNLAEHFPPFAGPPQLEIDPEKLGTLLGDVADQAVTAVVTSGPPGVEHRTRLAERIDAFRRDLAIDPNYAPIAAFLEAMVALLRAGEPIPASEPLVDPFDGLYEYVLLLIERKTGKG